MEYKQSEGFHDSKIQFGRYFGKRRERRVYLWRGPGKREKNMTRGMKGEWSEMRKKRRMSSESS